MEWTEIKLILEATDMPDTPGDLPIGAVVGVVDNKLHVRADRRGTIGDLLAEEFGPLGEDLRRDVVFEFEIPKEAINGVSVKLVADVPDDFEYSPWKQPEMSTVTLFHTDPLGVVPHFTTTFGSGKSYWIKAFRTLLRERLGLEATEEKT